MTRVAGRKISVIGDSHMEALGPRLRRLLSSAGASSVRTEARRGWSTGRYAAAGELSALAAGSDLVVVELGGNDSPGSSYAETVASVLRQVSAPGREVVWVGPAVATRPDVAIRHNQTADLQRAILASAGIRFIDGRRLTVPGELRDDHVHFSAEGYDRFATGILRELQSSSEGLVALLMVAALGTGVALLLKA